VQARDVGHNRDSSLTPGPPWCSCSGSVQREMDEVSRELAAINQQLAELTQRKRLLLRLGAEFVVALVQRRP